MCLQASLMYVVKDVDPHIEQTCDQNNDAEESETRHHVDDKVIVEASALPYLIPQSKNRFYPTPGKSLPFISLNLHCPPPNVV